MRPKAHWSERQSPARVELRLEELLPEGLPQLSAGLGFGDRGANRVLGGPEVLALVRLAQGGHVAGTEVGHDERPQQVAVVDHVAQDTLHGPRGPAQRRAGGAGVGGRRFEPLVGVLDQGLQDRLAGAKQVVERGDAQTGVLGQLGASRGRRGPDSLSSVRADSRIRCLRAATFASRRPAGLVAASLLASGLFMARRPAGIIRGLRDPPEDGTLFQV